MNLKQRLSAPGKATAVVGAQFGSEAKGACVAAMADIFDIHVRTGGPNAGHTIWHEGHKWKMRSVPCGWVNPEAILVIGPGAVLDAQLLLDEIMALDEAGYNVSNRLLIDPRAGVISDSQRDGEGGVHGRAHEKIGSTGEGVGLCRMARISRGTLARPDDPLYKYVRAGDLSELRHYTDDNCADYLRANMEIGKTVLLEGTQGSALSLTHGDWPYVTSADTNAAQLLADAGIPPSKFHGTLLVARTYPIRVAGNSGYLPNETSWDEVGQEPETTTVTGKIRRVGLWDWPTIHRAITLNDPLGIALTFLDYEYDVRGFTEPNLVAAACDDYLATLADAAGVPVVGVGTGPDTFVWL